MYNTDMPRRAELPSRRKLIRSTILAILAAVILLITVVLPAEYAVDPTGLGKALGLTEMGEIKQQLAEEADADETVSPTAQAKLNATSEGAVPAGAEDADMIETAELVPETAPQLIWKDVVTLTLAPGEAAEVKLTMNAGEVASYSWTADRGHLNSDLHADGANKAFISYRKGRAETDDSGELTAEFDGAHGWFWRNRSDVSVEVTLRVTGAYSEIKRVL
ncbi:MAG: transmembrane anchor protein [Litorimonas sp.]